MTSFNTPEPISVTLDFGIGDALIVASERPDTVIEVLPRNHDKGSDVKAVEEIEIEYSNGVLQIHTPKKWTRYLPFGGDGSTDITIELPAGSNIQADLAMGKFRSEGQLGECDIKTAMGDIRLDRTGKLRAKTGHGEITANVTTGPADFTTGSGKVRIREIHGTGVVRSSNGDCQIGEVTGDLRVKSANGDITVDRALSSVVAKTANGNIRIDDLRHGTTVLETAAGELEVGIHEGSAAWIDVSSRFGRVINSLTTSDGPGGSEDKVEVRGRTSYGDILIRRSEAEVAA